MKQLTNLILGLIFLLSFTLNAQDWTLNLQIQTFSEDGTITQTRTIGGDLSASDDFDSGLDEFVPPPGFNFYSYFKMDNFPNQLLKDIRCWQSPYQDSILWELALNNVSSNDIDSIQITWDNCQNSLISYFPFHGNALDMSDNQNHGDAINVQYINDRFGVTESAIELNGDSSYITIQSNKNFKPTLPVTICAWVKLYDKESNFVFGNDFIEDHYYGVLLGIGETLQINYHNGGLAGSASRRSKIGTTNLNTNEWVHVAGVIYANGEMDLYVNGINDQGFYTGNGNELVYSNANGVIGRYDSRTNGPPHYFNGAIDDVFFIKGALTEEQINEIMKNSEIEFKQVMQLPETGVFKIDTLDMITNNKYTVFADQVIDITYNPKQFNLTLQTNPQNMGSLSLQTGTHTYFKGDTVEVVAHSSQYYQFVNWTGDIITSQDSSISIIMNSNKTITANYESKERSLDYIFDQPGWYCLSFPLLLVDNHITNLFSTLDDSFAYTWDIQSQEYIECDTIAPQIGYFIAISEPDTVTLTGFPVYGFTESFTQAGWHLVGSNFGGCSFIDPNDIPDNQILSPAYIWDPEIKQYIETDTLNAELGSWIAVTDTCEWIVGTMGLNKSANTSCTSWDSFISEYGAYPPNPPVLSNVSKKNISNQSFKLNPNYPNPFNPSTTISYTLPEKSNVKIQILDLLGRVVDTLIEENQSAGFHQIEWNTSLGSNQNLASGIYFLQIKAGKYNQIQKMTLIK